MRRLLLLLSCITTVLIGNAQNLVPNGSFEEYSTCPTTQSQITRATPWMTPSEGYGTPDYYNRCADSAAFISVFVPYNMRGYQQPHSGDAYCGIQLWALEGPDNREYIEVPLTSRLTENVCYAFEMYVNLSNEFNYTSDAIGVNFSDGAITGITNYLVLPFDEHIVNTALNFFDTLNWTLVSGTYIATGGEDHITIGNFKNGQNTTLQELDTNNNTPNIGYVYCYIDDVSLVEIPPCNIGINEQQAAEVEIYPNPFSELLTINSRSNGLSDFFLFDIASKKILHQQFKNTVSINTAQLEKGIYFYEIRDGNGLSSKGKIVKE